ncbi:hypothetical protein M3585_12400 [Bacillus subtilis]|nr:hypothetical protein [Bacillus subtilis]
MPFLPSPYFFMTNKVQSHYIRKAYLGDLLESLPHAKYRFPIVGFAWDVAESGILILLAIYITSLTIFDDHFHYKIE